MIAVGIDWSMSSPAWTYINEKEVHHHYFFKCNRQNSQKQEGKKRDKEEVESKVESNFHFHPHIYPIYEYQIQRFHLLAEELIDSIKDYNMFEMNLVFEGYSFGATGKVFDIAESTGIAKYRLYYEYGIIPGIVPSAQWKKHFGLKGNSDKKPIVDLYIKETGNDLYQIFNKKPDIKSLGVMSDIADSYFIAKYAQYAAEAT